MRIVFAGTPEFALPALKSAIEHHDVVAVLTQPDRRSGRGKKVTAPPVKTLALQHNIEVHQPSSMDSADTLIKELSADVMIVVAYGMLLPQEVLDAPKITCINIHASLLPRWRGAAPIQRAIEAEDENTGVSIMKMELGLDTGPVYKMLALPINKKDTSASMHDKLAELGAKGLIDVLELIDNGADPQPQPQSDDGICYAKKLNKIEAEINWMDPANRIDARIRAFDPWPICQTRHKNIRIRVRRASVIDVARRFEAEEPSPGTIIDSDSSGLLVACGQGALRLELLQRDGSRQLPWNEFRNGYELKVGDVLGQDSE